MDKDPVSPLFQRVKEFAESHDLRDIGLQLRDNHLQYDRPDGKDLFVGVDIDLEGATAEDIFRMMREDFPNLPEALLTVPTD